MMSSDFGLNELNGELILIDGDKRYVLKKVQMIEDAPTYCVDGYYSKIKIYESPIDITFEMTKRTAEKMYAAMKRNFCSNNRWRRQGCPYTRTKVLARIKRNEKRTKE